MADNRTGEAALAFAIVCLLRHVPGKRATMEAIREGLPGYVRFTKGDRAKNPVRRGEPFWHQIIRNVRSHGTGRSYGLRAISGGFALEAKPAKHAVVRLRALAKEARAS
jgi:hypothetical protein